MIASAMLLSMLISCAGERYAIVVGVNKYQHARLPPLLYAVNDAKELAKFLSDAKYTVVELTDTSEILPTKDNIERAIEEILKKVNEHDTVLICLAGHGLQFEGTPDALLQPARCSSVRRSNRFTRFLDLHLQKARPKLCRGEGNAG